jgi:nucleotide-binding universal stress UspA family protein
MLGTIVVGVDSSEESRDAIALARLVAGAAGGSLLLVHAYPYDLLPLEGTVTEVQVIEDLRDEAAAFTAELRDTLAPGAATKVLPDTSPGRALHDVCEQVEAGLLVLGSHRRSASGRAAAGGTAKAALHHAPCPVLVAPRGVAATGRLTVKAIGVGFDGSPEARQALELGREVGEATGGEIVLLTAVAGGDDTAAARERMAEAGGGLPVEVLEGKAADALIARSERLDLLVLGSRGWGPVRRLLLGSTSERVVRDAGCAVLVVPRGD